MNENGSQELLKVDVSDLDDEGPTDRDKLIESAFHTEMCEVPADEEVVLDDMVWN